VVLLLMANHAGYRSKIHLSLLFKIPEPLLLLGILRSQTVSSTQLLAVLVSLADSAKQIDTSE
jgi:hypothetical protein